MRTLSAAIALGAAALLPAPGAMNPERLARLGPRMQALVDSGKAAGIVTLLEHQGQRVHLEARGHLRLEDKSPMRTDSIFEVMSMTKPVTATAIVMLAEEGKLALGDPVEKHLAEFRGQRLMEGDRVTAPARPITVRDLLTHSSGLPEFPPEGMRGAQFYRSLDRTLGEAVTLYSQMPLLFQPGTRAQYSNPGMATLGRLIEVLAGEPYEQFLARRIFAPLGMKDSFFFPPPDKRARVAGVYALNQGKLENAWPSYLREGARYSFPEGGLYATAADMAAFYRCFLNGGQPLLSRAGRETMLAVHSGETMRGGAGWGLGWSVTQRAAGLLDLRTIGAYGHGGAFGTLGWVDPGRQLLGVLMIQGGAADQAQRVFVEMANAAVE